ncbi:MAG TPA: CAP domain-containing protein [Anaerolineales bacterium]|nr:CAP domain-containing protein [Anaerolineales bacterium]
MIKKLYMVAALIMLALSACNGQGAVETATPSSTETQIATAPAVSTEAPTLTETATPSPGDTSATATSATLATITPTLGTPFPTNPPDCTNSASFVADVTVPDHTNVGGGTIFTKTWRISNTGTCVWGPNYTLVPYSDERLGAPASVPLGITYPGQNLDISVNLTAPSSTGIHQGNFVIKNPAGLIMKIGDDSRLWAIIDVTLANTTASTAVAAPTAVGSAVTVTSTVPVATAESDSTTTATCLFSIDLKKLTETIDAANAYRAQHGLPAYTVNMQLAQAAQKQANDMACTKNISHTGSDGSTPQTRVAATGYVASSVSENINGNYPPFDGQGVVNWWINDKTDLRHNQNLLSTTFTEIGVGYSFFNNFGYYVIVFAKP